MIQVVRTAFEKLSVDDSVTAAGTYPQLAFGLPGEG